MTEYDDTETNYDGDNNTFILPTVDPEEQTLRRIVQSLNQQVFVVLETHCTEIDPDVIRLLRDLPVSVSHSLSKKPMDFLQAETMLISAFNSPGLLVDITKPTKDLVVVQLSAFESDCVIGVLTIDPNRNVFVPYRNVVHLLSPRHQS